MYFQDNRFLPSPSNKKRGEITKVKIYLKANDFDL